MISIARGVSIASLALLTLVYLWLQVFSAADTIDFKYVWLAGDLWRSGQDPYSDVFAVTGEALFVGSNRPAFWLYPPNWWPVATVVSVPDYAYAGTLWRVTTVVFLVIGCLTLSRTVNACIAPVPLWRHTVFWACVGTMSATAITLSLGQTSGLVFLGICLFASAWLKRSVPLMIVALSLLALKPQVGLVIAGLLVPSLFWWRALLGAALVVIAMAVPSFLQDGLVEVLTSMTRMIREHGNLSVNGPLELSGFRNLAYVFLGKETATTTSIALGVLVSLGIGLRAHRASQRAHPVKFLLAALVTIGLFVPLHLYDLIFLATLIILMAFLPLVTQLAFGAGVFVIWRANNLENLLGLTPAGVQYGDGVLISSVTLFCLAAVLFLATVLKNPDPSEASK